MYVHLDESERIALGTMAWRELRTMRDQLRWLVREAAIREGLLSKDSAASSSLQRTQPVTTPNTAESADSAEAPL